jgi:putative tryptophan/tyrosine transport system substrate-binding protein
MVRKLSIFIFVIVILASVPFADGQQPTKIHRIGYLIADSRSAHADVRAQAFREGLRGLGYVEGKNIIIEWRQAEGNSIASPPLRPSWCVSR